ncbi:MAG: hypothetical protein GX442_06335, partial [Candidatus Riflebacteria bacterium]|nr:hypothetical protein [Candidatus Riflebacteria bacterium]
MGQELEETIDRAGGTGDPPGPVRLLVEAETRLSWAMAANGVPFLRRVEVGNHGPEALTGAWLDLRVAGEAQPLHRFPLPDIAPGSAWVAEPLVLSLPEGLLRGSTERRPLTLALTVQATAGERARADLAGEVLAAQEWDRTRLPELLAAFVTPNHPAVADLLPRVRDQVREMTDDPALDGYRGRSRDRVRSVVDAIYRVVAGLGLTYAVAPPSFETTGQKIRPAGEIREHRLANCLEASLLVAALAELAGLHAVLVVFRAHALPGVWLVDEWLPVAASDDPDLPRKLVRCGDLLLVEGTAALQPTPPPFVQAEQQARRRLDGEEPSWLIDVRASRLSRILPLPADGVAAPPPTDGEVGGRRQDGASP